MRLRTWLAAAVALAPGIAGAQVIDVQHDYSRNNALNIRIDTRYLYADVGAIDATLVTPVTGLPTSFDVYCVDLDHPLGTTDSVSIRATSATTLGEREAAWLYDTFAPGATTAAKASALQLSIWEAINDAGSTNLDGGNFQYYSDGSANQNNIKNIANSYLGQWNNQVATASWFTMLNWGPNPWDKDQDVIGPQRGSATVPEPTGARFGACAFGSAALFAGLLKRRRRSRA